MTSADNAVLRRPALEAGPDTRPFSNVKVLDFTRMLAGPFASCQLAILGAEVIKVESLEGDDTRNEYLGNGKTSHSRSSIFDAVNLNKKSIRLNLRKKEGVEIAKKLASNSDVVLENFRPGVMKRLGLGYEDLAVLNPRLIYCAVSGFGQEGPESNTAAFDGMIQATSGLMSLTGTEESGPMRAGFAACDVIAGATAAFALASALYQRTHTNKGQFVDVAMLDATMSFLRQQISEYTLAGILHGPAGNLTVSRKPTGDRFPTGRGFLVLAALSEKQFSSLMKEIGEEKALEDPRFSDWSSRIANSSDLRKIIEGALQTADAGAWESRLRAVDVPCARVWSISEVVNHPQLSAREVLQTVATPDGPRTLVGSGFKLAHGSGKVEALAPDLGEHTEQVLYSLGLTDSEIAELRSNEVI